MKSPVTQAPKPSSESGNETSIPGRVKRQIKIQVFRVTFFTPRNRTENRSDISVRKKLEFNGPNQIPTIRQPSPTCSHHKTKQVVRVTSFFGECGCYPIILLETSCLWSILSVIRVAKMHARINGMS